MRHEEVFFGYEFWGFFSYNSIEFIFYVFRFDLNSIWYS